MATELPPESVARMSGRWRTASIDNSRCPFPFCSEPWEVGLCGPIYRLLQSLVSQWFQPAGRPVKVVGGERGATEFAICFQQELCLIIHLFPGGFWDILTTQETRGHSIGAQGLEWPWGGLPLVGLTRIGLGSHGSRQVLGNLIYSGHI